MENKEKTPEQKAAEKLRKAQAMGDAISHFNMKLGVVPNDMLIEEQIKYLSKYHDVPSVEEMKANENKMDSYRQEFMNTLYDNYFKDYPDMLERLGDKKTDNNMANFYGLRLMAFLFNSGEEDESKRKENIEAYYKILPQYQDYLMDYIVNNQRWDLTVNTKEAFLAYNVVQKEHKALLAKYPSPLDIPYLIRDVRVGFYDKISHLKDLGLDDETYKHLVSDVVIGKFQALKFVMNGMAGGGANVLGTVASLLFQKYSLHDMTMAAAEAVDKFALDEQQKSQMDDVRKMLHFFRDQGFSSSGSSGSGCMLTLLLLLIPVSLLACIL